MTHGDRTALQIIERFANGLARICAVVGGLFDVERIILAGGVAAAAGPLLARTALRLAELIQPHPPKFVVSALGREVVSIGAASRVLSWWRTTCWPS